MPRRNIQALFRRLLGSTWPCAALFGCVGGGAPDDPYALPGRSTVVAAAGSSSIEPVDAGSRRSHFPLSDGATWTYHHTSFLDESWDEVANMRADGAAIIVADEEDAKGEQTQSTLVIDGTRVYRVKKQVLVGEALAVSTTYDPAFLRYDEAWTESGASVTLDDEWRQECVVASSASNCAPGAVKTGRTTHVFTVLDVAAEVSVPAGDFTAVKIRRDNPTDYETKLFWFAAGVGKVREENLGTGAVEELSAYEIP